MLKTTQKYLYISLIVVLVLALIGAVYITFFHVPACSNFECWQKYMAKCSKATFVNDEPEAAWGYKVLGVENRQCVINVRLLMAKQGELGVNELVGQEMKCYYQKGVAAYAEKDLSKCHGILKENLQTIVITKLHTYILENLGKFDESLNKVV